MGEGEVVGVGLGVELELLGIVFGLALIGIGFIVGFAGVGAVVELVGVVPGDGDGDGDGDGLFSTAFHSESERLNAFSNFLDTETTSKFPSGVVAKLF